jgi:threonine dehydrogenase-like Zn-dependent dehydrogenase
MNANAIVFQQPCQLSVRSLALRAMVDGDVAAEWKRADLIAVTQLVESSRLSLDGLVTHTETPNHATQAYEAAFGDPDCLKMVLDWRH